MNGRGSLIPALFLACGCNTQSAPPSAVTTSTLPASVTARVGAQLVSSATVERVAIARNLEPRAALDLAVADALFAEGARARLALGCTRSIERAAVARSLLDQLTRDATRAGDPTAAELADIVRERWVDVDRPAGARTTHAVVLNDKPERDAAAHAQANKLAVAVASATTDEELIQLAKDFKAEDGFEIRAESLPFVTRDGRIFQRTDGAYRPRPGAFDVAFARAAHALARPGELSPVVKSGFGYHVIRLDELSPSAVLPVEQRAQLFGPEIIAKRAGLARRELLEKLRPTAAMQLERAVDDLTGQVKAAP